MWPFTKVLRRFTITEENKIMKLKLPKIIFKKKFFNLLLLVTTLFGKSEFSKQKRKSFLFNLLSCNFLELINWYFRKTLVEHIIKS